MVPKCLRRNNSVSSVPSSRPSGPGGTIWDLLMDLAPSYEMDAEAVGMTLKELLAISDAEIALGAFIDPADDDEEAKLYKKQLRLAEEYKDFMDLGEVAAAMNRGDWPVKDESEWFKDESEAPVEVPRRRGVTAFIDHFIGVFTGCIGLRMRPVEYDVDGAAAEHPAAQNN